MTTDLDLKPDQYFIHRYWKDNIGRPQKCKITNVNENLIFYESVDDRPWVFCLHSRCRVEAFTNICSQILEG